MATPVKAEWPRASEKKLIRLWTTIVDRSPKRGEMMSASDVVDILSIPLIGIVPDDENVVISTNQGEPLVGNNTMAGRAYQNICYRVAGKEIPFIEFDKSVSFWTRVSGIFHKN